MGKYISVKEASNGLVLEIDSGRSEVFEQVESPLLRHYHIETLLTRLAEELLGHKHGSVYSDKDGSLKRLNVWITVTSVTPAEERLKVEETEAV